MYSGKYEFKKWNMDDGQVGTMNFRLANDRWKMKI